MAEFQDDFCDKKTRLFFDVTHGSDWDEDEDYEDWGEDDDYEHWEDDYEYYPEEDDDYEYPEEDENYGYPGDTLHPNFGLPAYQNPN